MFNNFNFHHHHQRQQKQQQQQQILRQPATFAEILPVRKKEKGSSLLLFLRE